MIGETRTAVEVSSASPLVNTSAKSALKARTKAIENLSEVEILRMFQLFSLYYESHTFEMFQKDLFEKNDVILLYDSETLVMQGFSTLLKVEVTTPGGLTRGIYSGDTVVARGYWGSTALGKAFLKYLWMEKIKKPFKPLYWFLISKGYKTYLMMANNFTKHWPRYEEPTPESIKKIMAGFYGQKFSKYYHAHNDLIIPEGESCHLKSAVAEIDEVARRNKRILFFETRNPNWKKGVELTCIAEMTVWMPFKYAFKKMILRTKSKV